MKRLAVATLLLTKFSIANSVGFAGKSACEWIGQAEIVFVGKSNRWTVVVETVVKGPVQPQAEYKLTKPFGYRSGERYLIHAKVQQPDGLLDISEAWDAKNYDARAIEALRETASGRGPRLFGTVWFEDRKPAGGLVPVFATGGPNNTQYRTLTQPGGHFEFQNIPPGDYKLTLGEASLEDRAAPVSVAPGIVRVPAQGCAMATIPANPNGWIEGIVRDASGTPVPNAKVRAYTSSRGFEATADAEGRYRFRGLSKGNYRVTYENGSVYVDLKDREGRAGIDLRIPAKIEHAQLTIEVVDNSGQPVQGAEVFLYPPPPAAARNFLPAGNTLSLRLTQGEMYSAAARLWRDGRQWVGGSSSVKLSAEGNKLLITLKPI